MQNSTSNASQKKSFRALLGMIVVESLMNLVLLIAALHDLAIRGWRLCVRLSQTLLGRSKATVNVHTPAKPSSASESKRAEDSESKDENYFNVIIVGAGLSGVGAAVRLQKDCPQKRFTILEGRQAVGGTWDLFRYPGIRSDSDMFTLGYSFKAWTGKQSIVDGWSIRNYIKEAAAEYGVEKKIRFGHKVVAVEWSSKNARWTVRAENNGKPVVFSCDFLYGCTGYYRYETAYTPDFADRDKFKGKIVHPQFWPEDLDYKGKKVVVIGSGATAMTLVPAMADTAGHVMMLQRSPTYVVTLPGVEALAVFLRKFLPEMVVYAFIRWKNVLRTTVTAGGMKVIVDGEEKKWTNTVGYKGAMFCGIPNFVIALGYTNASWTLKADLVAAYICRLLNFMDKNGYKIATPIEPDPSVPRSPTFDLTSGYVMRSIDQLPRQAAKQPWRLNQNYTLDIDYFRHGPVDEQMNFK